MFKFTKKLIIFVFLISAVLAVGHFVSAQTGNLLFGGLENETGNALGLGTTNDAPQVIIARLINIALGFLGIVAVGLIIYSGWLWMTAAENADRIEKAKKILIGAVIGLVIILASFAIATFVLDKLFEATGLGGGAEVCDPSCGAGETCCGGGCSTTQPGWGCCSGLYQPLPCSPGAGGNFTVDPVTPFSPVSPPDAIRNPAVRGYFSSRVSQASVNPNNFIVYVTGGLGDGALCANNRDCRSDLCDTDLATPVCVGDHVDGALSVSNNRITITRNFDSLIACPAPNDSIACLSEFTDFTIEAVDGGGLRSTAGVDLTCGGLSPECTGNFRTGDVVDVLSPTINLSITEQFCVGETYAVGATATDDGGIVDVEFFVDGASWFVDSAGSPPPPVFNALWNWDTTGWVEGTYEVSATASDVDSHTASDSENVTLHPAHCCDGIMNDDEEGEDCGGSCGACEGAACAIDEENMPNSSCSNDLCASAFCSPDGSDVTACEAAGYPAGTANCCLCTHAPVIDWITPEGGFCLDATNNPTDDFCRTNQDCTDISATYAGCDLDTPNGASGNLITIGGRYFGNVAGDVEFSVDGINWTPAVLGGCADSWQNSQIITVVPGIAAGSDWIIRVTADNGFLDTTNDDRGPTLDFIVNNIERPGLCSITEDFGVMNNLINYSGIRLTNSTAYFGNLSNNVEALNSVFISALIGTAQVPNIATGNTTTYVENLAGVNSNFLRFTKNSEPAVGPQITSFDPVSGPVGQYVTIYGSGFGGAQGGSHVYFGAEGENEADYDFPNICADSVWGDNQVIVKVPAGIANGNYIITMAIGSFDPVNTSGLTEDEFTVNNDSLRPSLCRIQPTMGPNNSDISLWGEYFGASADTVRFHLNQDQTGAAITYWGADGDAQRIDTTVPANAASGPVSVVQGGNEGNGINFQVGLCTEADNPDAACGAEVCCGEGTFNEGRCVADMNDCYAEVTSSVYEWDFSTGVGTIPETCSGYSLNQCSDTLFCPNSPGQCSPYSGGQVITTGSCSDANCDNFGACGLNPGTCTYDINLNKCVDLNQGSAGDCSLDNPNIAQDIFNNPVIAYCADYQGSDVWHFNTNSSCPAGWVIISGGKCADLASTCYACNSGFVCADDNDGDLEGLCAVNQNVCPNGSTCNSGTDNCETTDQGKCECCCDISAPAGQDCCVGLTCGGTCGEDQVDDGVGFGECSGCANAGTTQAEHDASCNCEGTIGKVCVIDDPGYPEGVCRDGAATGEPCYDPAIASGCDSSSPNCVSVADYCDNTTCTCQPVTVGTPCDGTPATAECTDIGICNGVPDLFCDSDGPDDVVGNDDDCTCQVDTVPPGSACDDPESTNEPPACDLTLCGTGYGCSSEAALVPGNCGFCCCDINDDHCGEINEVLTCNYVEDGNCEDTNPDTVPDFGLCCGCESDGQCGNSAAAGCGSDTCCRARPAIDSVSPNGGETEVCRNREISATFDQRMYKSSFSGNIIVAGDYGTDSCPQGTQYILTKAQEKRGIFARMLFKIKRSISRILKPVFPQVMAITNNFCAIGGSVKSFNNPDDTTTVTFSPDELLDANRTYYVIIKGDSNSTDSVDEGILSYWKVSMADNWPDLDGNGTPAENNDRMLNGEEFYGYAWSFTTRNDMLNNGICRIDHVEIIPSSYLFKTTEDDLDESDTSISDNSFDSRRDNDKVFTVRALGSGGQPLSEVPGVYEWDWEWNVNPNSVVNFDLNNPFAEGPPADNSQLFEAVEGVTDGSAIISATATVSGSAEDGDEAYTDESEVWVFTCENPWPAVGADGTWEPWRDSPLPAPGGGCISGTGACHEVNYEIYYCRDAGRTGTYDDLPTILSDDAIIRGESDDLLKEFYFFREEAPAAVSGSVVVADLSNNREGVAQVSWPAAAGANSYRLYYGTRSGNYSSYIDAGNFLTNTVEDLNIGRTYYFAVTSFDIDTGAESEYSPEASATLADTIPPDIPLDLSQTSMSCNGEVTLSWDANAEDTEGYTIYYGANSGAYGGSEDVGDSTEVTLTGFSGDLYYFAVKAYDAYDNESGFSNELEMEIADCGFLSALVSRWSFDEGSGAAAFDSAGSNNGILEENAGWSGNGIMADAVSLNGAGQFISVPSSPSLNFGANDFTISLWVRFNNLTGEQVIAEKYVETGGVDRTGWSLTKLSTNDISIGGPGGGAGFLTITPPGITVNNWYFITVVRNGDNYSIYWNGSIVGTPAAVAGLDFGSTSSLKFGHRGNPDDTPGSEDWGGYYLNGYIDDAAIFNRALGDDEIRELYNSYPTP